MVLVAARKGPGLTAFRSRRGRLPGIGTRDVSIRHQTSQQPDLDPLSTVRQDRPAGPQPAFSVTGPAAEIPRVRGPHAIPTRPPDAAIRILECSRRHPWRSEMRLGPLRDNLVENRICSMPFEFAGCVQ